LAEKQSVIARQDFIDSIIVTSYHGAKERKYGIGDIVQFKDGLYPDEKDAKYKY
jgi:hypothetical protein